MQKPKLLIFTINPVHNAPRVIREIDSLKEDFEIIVAGHTPPTEQSVTYINSDHIRLSHFEYTLGKVYRVFTLGRVFKKRYFTTQSKIDSLLSEVRPDLVIVHPGAFLPYFSKKNKNYKLIFNAHEFHPKEFEGDMRWKNTWGKIYDTIYKNYLPKVDLMINVCDGIAQECQLNYGKHSLVIPNAGPFWSDLTPIHKSSGKIRMIHHGVAIKERKLEIMIELTSKLGERFELDLMLVYEDEAYYSHLSNLAAQAPNVRIVPPVNFGDIVPFIHQYDIGLFLLPPVNFNYLHALPNKFFEFVQARIAIAVGPSPEMAGLVKKYNLGIVSEDFSVDSMFEKLTSLTHPEINQYKIASHNAAEVLNSEQFEKLFLVSIKNLLN